MAEICEITTLPLLRNEKGMGNQAQQSVFAGSIRNGEFLGRRVGREETLGVVKRANDDGCLPNQEA